jgi:5-methyltetrahydrofolate--homocysteine methyltransferase
MTSAAESLRAAAAQGIVVKDGPYGTAIQNLGLTAADYAGHNASNHDQKGNNDILNLTRPDAIAGICNRYIAAGARLLATNTFNANRISQADYGMEDRVREINLAAARIMRECVDAAIAADGIQRWVAGSLGPTNKTLSLSPRVSDPGYREVTFDGVKDVYREQIEALLEGGVDFILIETVFDTLNAKAAAFAAAEAGDARGSVVPVMLSMTLTDLSGRNLSGQTVEAFWHSIRHVKPVAVGLNCSFGATELRPHVQALARQADTLIMTYPNAGLPNDLGEYDEQPETTAGFIRGWAEEGLVNIVGGCCGNTPEHIAAMARQVAGLPPRVVPQPETALYLTGLEAHRFAA